MRKVIVLSFITLDGVMQGPGGPEEDASGDFNFGGWSVGYVDDFVGNAMVEQIGHSFDLLLGRNTYEILAFYWLKEPGVDGRGLNNGENYGVLHHPANIEWETPV